MCLSVSEIRSCQGEGRKFTYFGYGSQFVQTDKACSLFFQPGSVQSYQHLRCDPTQQLCSGCISNPDWTISMLRQSPAPQLCIPCLVSPTCSHSHKHCPVPRQGHRGQGVTALPPLLGSRAQTAAASGGLFKALFCNSQRCLKEKNPRDARPGLSMSGKARAEHPWDKPQWLCVTDQGYQSLHSHSK